MDIPAVPARRADVSIHTEASLEFGRIRRMLCAYIASESGRAAAMRIAPSADAAWISYELTLTGECMRAFQEKGSLPALELEETGESLQRLRVAGSVLDAEALAGLCRQLDTVVRVCRYFKGAEGMLPLLYAGVLAPLDDVRPLREAVERVFDERYGIRDNASPELAKIRRQRRDVHRDLEKKISSLAHTLGQEAVLQEERFTIRAGRLVLPVKAEQMGAVSGVVHDRSASGATLFVEPMETVGHNNRLKELEMAERNELLRIMRMLSDTARPHAATLETNRRMLIRLEFVAGKAAMAAALGSRCPGLGDAAVLVGARHPLLLASVKEGEERPVVLLHPGKAVPLDLTLGDGPKTLVITGPNAGGKTVALKTLGLLTLMVQSGLPVPVGDGTVFRVFDRIAADIGDEQSIENDLSTFSSHMKRISEMVADADDNSLVLIDELCTGTDPDFSTALAMAVLEHFTARGCMTAVTTHYGALKAFAHERDDVMNGSMVFDEEGLVPTYRFRPGLPGGSYAFEVSRKVGLAPAVVARAGELIDPGTRRVEDLVADLEQALKDGREQQAAAEAGNRAAEALKAEYEVLLNGARAERRTMLEEAREAALRIVADASRLVEKTVENIRKEQASAESIKQARIAVQEAKAEAAAGKRRLRKEAPPATLPGLPVGIIRPGDRVLVAALQQEGTVISESEDIITVSVHDKLVRVRPDGLRQVVSKPGEEAVRKARKSGVKTEVSFDDMSPELNLIGKTADEGLYKLDQYLDRAVMAGLQQVNIIHGMGSGVLRNRVRDYLDRCPLVAGYRAAEQNAGGNGVTVVKMNS